MSHTPGPWEVRKRHGRSDFVFSLSDNRAVAETYPHKLIENTSANANARLIAAAPDLLKACKRAVSLVHGHTTTHREVERMIWDAIAKATGDDA